MADEKGMADEKKMTGETEDKLARSLTAETTELLPFLPYLLQDLWELGSNPRDIVKLIEKHMPVSKDTKMLDLACGKGAVSIRVAEEFDVRVDGFDLMPEFIAYAERKANEHNVSALCRFAAGDANDITNTARDYDCVIFGAAGNILGGPRETILKLLKTVKRGGYIIIVEAYLRSGSGIDAVKFKYDDYLTRDRWACLFEDIGLRLVDEMPANDDTNDNADGDAGGNADGDAGGNAGGNADGNADGKYDFDAENKAIALRAGELIALYPEKRLLFESYVQSQLNECEDLENSVVGVTWMLRKEEF